MLESVEELLFEKKVLFERPFVASAKLLGGVKYTWLFPVPGKALGELCTVSPLGGLHSRPT